MSPKPFPRSSHDPAELEPPHQDSPQQESAEQRRQDVLLTELWCQMLINCHDLAEALPEGLPSEPVPSRIWSSLRRESVPSAASLGRLSPEIRAELRLQTGCACGFHHLQQIGYADVCERANQLQTAGDEGSYLGGCLLLLLSLVLSLPPSETMVAQLSQHYSNADADLERSEQFLFELMLSLLARHTQEVLQSCPQEDDEA
ncbi:hypothetical protein BBFGKLBO_02951 [Synechococcus sp. CBW1107]|uniref:hypothetical protein n=1 Tax=Synechococcus sp. CBW1107 TaxID=2789857 RepID=UPI002AD39103|nr:hypothetical protein [Synechococcus sp. CBW1107]CAK6700838.1 hypothetical protein BBFGKLBO_02951 [Synechococcus sp. CBW1107]